MKLVLLGDIALIGRMVVSNNSDWKHYFSNVKQLIKDSDFVIGNLESPFSIRKKTRGAKSAYLFSEVNNIEILRYLNINAVSLANNHIFDYGIEGYETTKKVLSENGIEWFGSEGKSLILERNGNRLACEGFCCYSSNPLCCCKYGGYGVNEYNIENVLSIVEHYKDTGYLPLLSVHAGIEHVNYPSVDTIKCAHLLASQTPIIYYGHHPHVVQGIEELSNSLIAYSLGNFCFDDVYSSVSTEPLVELSENNRSSCVLFVEIENNIITNWYTVPIYIDRTELKVGKGVTTEELKKYSDALVRYMDEDYQIYRRNLIQEYISGRKNKRNLVWYLKRLRPRYFRILTNAKNNKADYFRCVTSYLNCN